MFTTDVCAWTHSRKSVAYESVIIADEGCLDSNVLSSTERMLKQMAGITLANRMTSAKRGPRVHVDLVKQK